jgi:hypothetical protein
MSYQSISVKEAVENVNSHTNGWFLPAIQRPYVWGSRYESEKYICKLFDSVLRGYPIGGLIVWNTPSKIAYREFIDNYKDGGIPKLAEEGVWDREDKGLVYDGQQRLQTLFSCLKHTFNGKIIVFDLLYNLKRVGDAEETDELDETGFSFVKQNSILKPNLIKMNNLFSRMPESKKVKYRKSVIDAGEWTREQEEIIEENIDTLWKIFVERDKKSLAYFKITTTNESEVNEIFQRLNSGGIQLSQSDLLLSRIKGFKDNDKVYYDFEEQLQLASKEIYNSTGKGYLFDAYNILQLLHLFVKERIRVDSNKVKDSELAQFKDCWDKLETPLKDFLSNFIWGKFKINNSAIIPRNLTLLPLIVFVNELYQKGIEFRKIGKKNINLMEQFFIKSQINDWNLQSYIDNFSRLILEKSKKNKGQFYFPLNEIENHIKQGGLKRYIDLSEDLFKDYKWFALKVLTPNRIYQFEPDIKRRFNPEIDHIFPIKLENMNDEYKEDVDIVWNMQPVKGDVNRYKYNYHPLHFFKDKLKDKKGNTISGSKYVSEYDFIPKLDSSKWLDYKKFIGFRKNEMKRFLEEKYGLKLIKAPNS